ncbi:hypothetical protein V5O48_019412, partial [Marasmius crinis-equi]
MHSHRQKRIKISEFLDVEAAGSEDEGEDELGGLFESDEEAQNQELQEVSRKAFDPNQEDEWDGFVNHLAEKYGPNRCSASEATTSSTLLPAASKSSAYTRSQLRRDTQSFVSSQSQFSVETNPRIRVKALMHGTRIVGDANGSQWLKEDETQWQERQRHGVASGEWVVVRSGTYKGDVGLAVQPDLVGYTTSTMEGATDLQKTIM